MGTWRCPHCATLQVEAARCFLCNRSATSCGTCASFRRSLVGGVGYCALDARREPLSGAEQRPCWSVAAPSDSEGLFGGLADPPPASGVTLAAAEPVPPLERRLLPGERQGSRGLIELEPRAGLAPRGSPPVSGT